MDEQQTQFHKSFQMSAGGNRSMGGQLLTGLIFVVVGVGLLLDTMNVLEFWPFVRQWWPSALMIIALGKIITRSGSLLGSGILFAIGALLQLSHLNIIDGFWSAFWPIVLILIGISLIAGKKKYEQYVNPSPVGNSGEIPYEHDRITSNAVFGGSSVRVTSKHFQGGDITAAFGGLEIDMRGAEIEGNVAVLKASAILGGIELRVPPHWTVVVKGTPVLGGIEDKTIRFRDANVLGPSLVIDATVVLGGIEIS